MNISEMNIIVTGAGGGMGAYFAEQIAKAGGNVSACDLHEEGLQALALRCANYPGSLFTHRCDVSNEEAIATFIDASFTQMGGLNGLINNAGLLRDGLLVKKDRKTGEIITMSSAQWHQVLAVNLTGATFMVRDVVAKMLREEQGPGVIVNMSSIARHGNRGQSNYVAAKAALAANTVTWAQEFGKFGIRVGAIAPGMIETPMTQGMNPKAREALVAAVPVGRVGVPEAIWQAVEFIFACDYFTARTIDVDGGLGM